LNLLHTCANAEEKTANQQETRSWSVAEPVRAQVVSVRPTRPWRWPPLLCAQRRRSGRSWQWCSSNFH